MLIHFNLLSLVLCQASDNVCENNGTCYINSGRVLCKCLPGYTGLLCEFLIDNCDSVPCFHGGKQKNYFPLFYLKIKIKTSN